jgi:hypothetical protein
VLGEKDIFSMTKILSITHGSLGQLILRSQTRYFAKGSIIADSREEAKGLIVITSGQVALLLCSASSVLRFVVAGALS